MTSPAALAWTRAARFHAEPERDLTALAARLKCASSSLVQTGEQAARRRGDEVVTWHGQPLCLAALQWAANAYATSIGHLKSPYVRISRRCLPDPLWPGQGD
jgi:hypothetical protein